MLASTVVIAALQRALGGDGDPLFLTKGGVYLEMSLGLEARATKDIDTLFRGSVNQFTTALSDVLSVPWGPFTLETTDIEVITGSKRLVKPRRFDVQLIVRGAVWRKVKVEVSFPEGMISEQPQFVQTPPIGFFGMDAPDHLAAIAMDYQVAQKLHACTDPGDEHWTNDRVRDVIDLKLLHDNFYSSSSPSSLTRACVDLFESRASEDAESGQPVRSWPPTIQANDVWRDQYPYLAASVGLDLSLEDIIDDVQSWITEIDTLPRKSDLGSPFRSSST
jgi:hypothetical protein